MNGRPRPTGEAVGEFTISSHDLDVILGGLCVAAGDAAVRQQRPAFDQYYPLVRRLLPYCQNATIFDMVTDGLALALFAMDHPEGRK